MNLKECFRTFIDSVKPQKKLQTEEGKPEARNPRKSMLEPVLPKIYGLKKNLIVFLVLGILLILLSSVIFGYFSGRGKPNKPVSYDIQPAIEMQDPSKAIPDNYAELAKYNVKNNQAAARSLSQNPNESASSKNQSPTNDNNAQVPPITTTYNPNMTGGYPYYAPPVPPGNADNPEPDKYRGSSIRFFSNSAGGSHAQAGNPVENDVFQNANGNDNNDAKKKSASGEGQNPNYNKLSRFQLTAGTIIPATLVTGLNSDLPGQIIAQVRQNVYDSVTGRTLLMPQGSRLIGEYGNSNIKNGQNRISVNWNRLILPNGYSLDLDNMPGVDVEGYAGLHDKVNNHTAQIVRAAFFTSALSAGAMYAAGNQSSDSQTPGQAAVAGAAANILTTGQKILDRNLDISPTIIVRPGTVFSVFVNRDLILKPY